MLNNFERYHCQISLPGFGADGQACLQKASVLIVGVGGLGCPAAQYLTAAGIGTIGIADSDIVSENNLHRQILFSPADIGFSKVEVAAKKLQQLNPLVRIIPFNDRVTSSNVLALINSFDLVIDGTDNFETKYLLNDACVLLGKPLVYGAIYQYEGQVSVLNVPQKDGAYSPNYRDIFPNVEQAEIPNCASGGVIPTLAGVIGSMQANEAIKYFVSPTTLLAGKLWMLNVLSGEARTIQLKTLNKKITSLTQTIETITFTQLQTELNKFELIDVRTPDEHINFNIGGKNIPLDDLEISFGLVECNRPVVFYCTTGKRSVLAAAKFKKLMPDARALSLQDGISNI